MDFDWSKPYSESVSGSKKDIHLGADKLDRARYAEFLTKYLSTYDNAPYVINLNAEWGAGKTYFLQRWYHTIKAEHPAVYIDAWQHDFSDDPLLTVISAITESLQFSSEQKYLVVNTLKGFVKHATPALISGLIKNYTGFDTDKIKLENFADAAEKAMEFALQDHQKKITELEQFKSVIKDILKTKTNNTGLRKPMFVFIDELDRCRPTYAIELLETVKHLFDIPGLVFVIATNTEQLQHAIKAVYGAGFDAQKYLYRFFNRSFTLKQPDLKNFIESQTLVTEKLVNNLLSTCENNFIAQSAESVVEALTAIAEGFNFDLRTTLQWLDQLTGCLSLKEKNNEFFWPVLAILQALKLSDKHLFDVLITHRRDQTKYDMNKKELMREEYRGILAYSGKYENKIKINISKAVFADLANNYPVGANKTYGVEIAVDPETIHRISFYLNLPYEKQKMTGHSVAKAKDKDVFLEMAIFFVREKYGTEIDKYIDMVELASNLD